MENTESTETNKKTGEENITETLDNQIPQQQQSLLDINMINADNEIIPRETVNSIYGDNYDLIKIKMKDTQNQTIDYLNNAISKLRNKYDEFNSDINNHFFNLTSKITNAFKLNNNAEENMKKTQKEKKEALIKKYSIEYIKQLQKIINMHQQIFTNIQKTFSIFYDFLDVSKFLSKEKPINEFLSKEFKSIVHNWLFMEVDLGNFDFTKSINDSNLDSDLKNLIIKIRKNNDFIMNISNPNDYMKASKKIFEKLHPAKIFELKNKLEKDQKIMYNNHNNLVKLKIKNCFDADKYFTPDVEYNKLKVLKFDNISFSAKDETYKNKYFLKNIPSVEKLIINSANNFEISILKDLSKSLIKLSLTKNGFVDYEFNNIISNYLLNNDNIRKNLQYLSFKDNYLTNVNLSQLVYQPKHSFLSLKELNFQNNKIFQFSLEPEYFPELKCINCCYNNLTRDSFEQYPGILTLLCGNVFLSQKNLSETYFSSLAKKLNEYTISLTYLNLSFIPKILSNDYIKKIIISDPIIINLKKLDLSYNNLESNTVIEFLNNNKGCLSLKYLNLSNNLLDVSFLDKFLESGLNKHFSKLKYIKLDSNKFGNFDDFDFLPEKQKQECINVTKKLYQFIDENKNLVELTITRNPFCKYLVIKSFGENSMNYNFNDYISRDQAGNIEIKCFYSFIFKINIEMNQDKKENKSEIRPIFNIKFDCKNSINNNLSDFQFNSNYIVFASQG